MTLQWLLRPFAWLSQWRVPHWTVFGLSLALMASYLAQVWISAENRLLATALYEQTQRNQQLLNDWGRMQLELGHLTNPVRIDRLARQELKMKPIEHSRVIEFYPKPNPSTFSSEMTSDISPKGVNPP